MSDIFVSKEFAEKWEKLRQEALFRFITGDIPEKTVEDRVKIAFVTKDDKKIMLGVDNETMEGYKMDENYPTIKKPLERENYNVFIRWCTSFDL